MDYLPALDLARLRALVAVARAGTVTAAAELLGYAQPSVSHQLARLEEEVGVPLLQRAGRRVRLTEAGAILVRRAEEILGQVDATQRELAAHAGLRSGRLRLASFPSALATIVPPAIARMAAEHPGLELTLVDAEPPEALRALRNGEADVAVLFEYPGDTVRRGGGSANLTVTPLLEDPVHLVTSKQSGASTGDAAGLTEYSKERWIAGCERCRAHLLSACARAGFSPEISYETDDYMAVQALVAAGMGVSMLPGLALRAGRNPAVHVQRLSGDSRLVYVATYGNSSPPLPTQAFVAVLTESVAPAHA